MTSRMLEGSYCVLLYSIDLEKNETLDLETMSDLTFLKKLRTYKLCLPWQSLSSYHGLLLKQSTQMLTYPKATRRFNCPVSPALNLKALWRITCKALAM